VTAVPALIRTTTGVSTITVTVRDETGARVAGAIVSLSASGSGTTITQPAEPTNVDGVTTGTLRSTSPGAKEVTAVVNGSVPLTQKAQVKVAGPVDHLEFLKQPRNVREGERFTVEVALVDADGNVVPLSGIEIYVDLFRAKQEHPDNTRALGDRFRDTVNGVAVFELGVLNGSSGRPVGRSESGYRLRALTDDLPEFGQGGPRPYLFSRPFDVD
jgi:adhesin/invasin